MLEAFQQILNNIKFFCLRVLNNALISYFLPQYGSYEIRLITNRILKKGQRSVGLGRRFLSLLFVLINLKYSESVLNRSDLLPTPDPREDKKSGGL